MANLDFLKKVQEQSSAGQKDISSLGTSGLKRPDNLAAPTMPVITPKKSRYSGVNSDLLKSDIASGSRFLSSPTVLSSNAKTGPRNQGYGMTFGTGTNVYNPNESKATGSVPDQGSWWDTAVSKLSSPIKTLMKGVQYALGSADAAVAMAGNVITSAGTSWYEMANPDVYGVKGKSFGEVYKQNFMAGAETAKKYLEGEGTATQITNEVWGPDNASGVGTTIIKTLADIALSPSTFLTLGVGSGAKVANTAGKEFVLTKEGTNIFKQAVKDAITNGSTKEEAMDLTKQAFSTAIADGSEIGGKNVINLIDTGGIKLGGKTIKGTDKALDAAVNSLKSLTSHIVESVPGMEKISAFMKDLFVDKISQVENKIVGNIAEKWRTAGNALRETYKADVDKLLKGISNDALEIMRNRGNESILSQLTPEMRTKADEIYKFLDNLGDDAIKHNIPIEKIDNYVPQLYKESPKQITKKLDQAAKDLGAKVTTGQNLTADEQKLYDLFAQGKGTTQKISGQPWFVQEKFFKDPALAQVAGLTPLSFRDTLIQRTANQAYSIAKNGMVDEIVDKYGYKAIKANAKEGISTGEAEAINQAYMKDVGKSVSVPLDNGQVAIIPGDIADYVKRITKSGGSVKDLPMWAQVPIHYYDLYTQAFKTLVTSWFPAFSIRNMADNLLRESLDVNFVTTLNPKLSAASALIALKRGGEEKMTLGGIEYTLGEIRGLAEKYGVIGTGEVAKTGLQAARKATDPIENFTRLHQFMANLEITGDIQTAAQRVKKFQYDYSNLTGFEREVMQRIFPFYTFTRKNIPFQLERIVKQPNVYGNISRMYQQIQSKVGSTDPNAVPDYISKAFSMPLGIGADGNMSYLGELGFSYEGANQALDVFSKRGIEQNILSAQLNPAIKMAAQWITQKNFFTGNEWDSPSGRNAQYQMAAMKLLNGIAPGVVQYQDGVVKMKNGTTKRVVTANPVIENIFENLPTSRITSTISNLMRPDKTSASKVASGLSGLKIYNVNEENTASANKYYSAKKIVDNGIETLKHMHYIRTLSNGMSVVDNSFSSGNDELDSKMRTQASELLKARSNPEEYVKNH